MDTKLEQLTQPLVSDEAIGLGKSYIDKLKNGQINLKEFLEDIAYMAIQDKYGFAELRPHPLPTVPYELTEFESLPFEERQKIRSRVYETSKIKVYLAQKREVELRNRANYRWICEIRAIIKEKGDPINLNRVQQRIYEFEEKAFE